MIIRVVAVCLFLLAMCSASPHNFSPNQEVVLWFNKIGPYHNPQETYTYYTLPFCKPKGDFHEIGNYAGIGEGKSRG